MPKLRRPRDANGFMVPLEGTKSRVIYELLRRGLRSREIIEATGYNASPATGRKALDVETVSINPDEPIPEDYIRAEDQ